MKAKTIKAKVLRAMLITIMLTLITVAIAFHLTISVYFQNRVMSQLSMIARSTTETFIKQEDKSAYSPKDRSSLRAAFQKIRKSFDKKLSIMNAECFLVDTHTNIISLSEEYTDAQSRLELAIFRQVGWSDQRAVEQELFVHYDNVDYAVILIPAATNTIGIQAFVMYASLEDLNAMKQIINMIMILILFIAALFSMLISSYISKGISKPLTSLSEHIRNLSERKFHTNIELHAENEIQELVDHVNKMSEQLEVYDQAQRTFLQNASHEFRTPLMVIQSYAEGLKHGIVEDQQAAIDLIHEETKRIGSLVEELLYLSRLDTVEENYRFSSLDLNELIKSVMERMNGLAEKERIQLKLMLPSADISLEGDEEKLARAMANVLGNAIRYAQRLISIRAEEVASSMGTRVELTVSDDGPGFDAEGLSNLFIRFYKGKKGKFGLGLAISKTIVEKHGGFIDARNRPEGGAEVVISLPIRK
jgi:two-component system, OmpR family, sensor histidine kinase CssS